MKHKNDAEYLSTWYKKILNETNFIIPGPVKGTMFFSSELTRIWKNIIKEFEKHVIQNLSINMKEVIFPTLIPMNLIDQEKEHIAGLKSELWITKRKNSMHDLVLRPTSEVLFSYYLAKQNLSYTNFPIGYYQWANVFRIEENVKALLRTSEFLWQEGHTYHLSENDAVNFTLEVLHKYINFFNDVLLLPTFHGEKTKAEKFAGAKRTYGIETIMKDGQAVQIATTHNLSNNFTKLFNCTYIANNNIQKYPFGSSWGFSTRALGAMLLLHGDENGFVLPSQLAVNQVTIISIDFHKWPREYQEKLDQIQNDSKHSINIQYVRGNFGPIRWKTIKKGIPLIITLGKLNFDRKETVVNLRKPFDAKESIKNIFQIPVDEFDNAITRLLKLHDKYIWQEAKNYWHEKIQLVDDINMLKKRILQENTPVLAFINLTMEEEKQIKKTNGFSIRILIKNSKSDKSNKCVFTNKGNAKLALIARAY